VGFDQDDAERCVGILASVFIIPTPQPYLSPSRVFQFRHRIGLSPGLRLLERKALSVDTRAAMATIRSRSAIQDTVTPHPHQRTTRFIPQRAQEAVVAILGIGYDEI
jgi:hypothetical protein